MDSEMAYPLAWPTGRPRTPERERVPSRFDVTLSRAVSALYTELGRIDARMIVVSSNLDGYEKAGVWRPYSHAKAPDDPGVAVYFIIDSQSTAMACDKWPIVRDNIRAISLTLESMRAMDRWGSSSRRQQFAGYKALAPSHSDWRTVLGFSMSERPTGDELRGRHRFLARAMHPDLGGSHADMTKLNLALDAAIKELAERNAARRPPGRRR